jgi:glutathione peroxidase
MTTHLLLLLNFFFFFAPPKESVPKSIYDFKVESIDGRTINFADYKGKKILIVNTASKCGYTPQYADLEKVYARYKDRMVIVGFPANDFGAQEPGSNSDIKSFCQKNYGVTFPMAAKITVKGDNKAPIYQWLTEKKYNGFKDSDVKWNFQKYLINEKGELIGVYESNVKPDNAEIISKLDR